MLNFPSKVSSDTTEMFEHYTDKFQHNLRIFLNTSIRPVLGNRKIQH